MYGQWKKGVVQWSSRPKERKPNSSYPDDADETGDGREMKSQGMPKEKGSLTMSQDFRNTTSLPPTLVLHHAGIDWSRRAGKSNAGLWVHNRNDFSGTSSRGLLEMHGINIMRNTVDIWSCGGGTGWERNAWRHLLLGGLNLVLQRRGLRRTAGQGWAIRCRWVDRMQLRLLVNWKSMDRLCW